MANKHGEFIWYELMTRDPQSAKTFYDSVVDWNIGEPLDDDGVGYRQIAADDGFVGGVFPLTDEMCAQGARPTWIGYIGVEDVDATVARAQELGGRLLMAAKDIPGVGRLAMIADPEGVPFYVMRGAIKEGTSTAFAPDRAGHCMWNELATKQQSEALSFYGELFGWDSAEGMPMGEMGEYKFLDHGDLRFGALSPYLAEGETPVWTYYFRVTDIDAAARKTGEGGGKVLHGPTEVPGGDYMLIGSDPEGTTFALAGPKKN